MIPFRPMIARDEYEAPLLFSLPMEPWTVRSGGLGGSAVSSAGIPASYVIREEEIAEITLRCTEAELPAVIAELRAIRATSEAFTFAFDQDDPATDYLVYLQAPVWPDEIKPERDGSYRDLFRLKIEVRRVDGSPFDLTWVEQEAES